MPYYARFKLNVAGVNDFCKASSTSRGHAGDFRADFFRSISNTYTDFEETQLSFNLSTIPATLTMKHGDKEHTENLDGSLLAQLNELRPSLGTTFSLTVHQLKHDSRFAALREVAGDGDGSPLYRLIADTFKDHLKPVDDPIYPFTHQSAFLKHMDLLMQPLHTLSETKPMINLGDGGLVHPILLLRDQKNPDQYRIQFSRSLMLTDLTPLDRGGLPIKRQIAMVYLNGTYSRSKQGLISDPEITLEFDDSYSPQQVQKQVQQLQSFIQTNLKNLNALIAKEGKPKLAQPTISRGWHPLSRSLISVMGIIMAASITLLILSALGILPALPFLAGISLSLGLFSLNAATASALVIGIAGAIISGLALGVGQASRPIAFSPSKPSFLIDSSPILVTAENSAGLRISPAGSSLAATPAPASSPDTLDLAARNDEDKAGSDAVAAARAPLSKDL